MKSTSDRFAKQRKRMLMQLRKSGIRDPVVLDAFSAVPREAFVSIELKDRAYDDTPLPIGSQQTISQPYIVALMTEALQLKPTDRVLEVGTGSGYAAAILAEIADEVVTVERFQSLADSAQTRLHKLGYNNVNVIRGDGTQGWLREAPYDAIIVAAGGPELPQPLVDQLKIGGRLVMPVGDQREMQILIRATKHADGEIKQEKLACVRFVPLVGLSGWKDEV
ncbi:MAG: protein-L-isoaspartate(D-aspartate) O-methyltransferase [Pirellulaceae bacterium]|jgi:protein-L-isoaspartate(D-aspartate) O-methyltransferase|nr:protein-L-isoaspartate(D-aspartate) O-methyltransferase [Pirellulaceae bacterium]